jgi:dihydroorotate dehydrogenase electron transfer subunit
MKLLTVRIKTKEQLTPGIFLMGFDSAYLAKVSQPGQFLHIKPKSTILRRPISIHNIEQQTVYILFKVRGRGTKEIAEYKPGDQLDILGPLGKGFRISSQSSVLNSQNQILLAGGIGIAPLYFLAKVLKKSVGKKNKYTIILGAKNKQEIVGTERFKELGYKVLIATDDGSIGFKGTGIAVLKNMLTTFNLKLETNIYCCGPEVMLKALSETIKNKPGINCQVSFEQFMGCGIGVCCGCTIETKNGHKKVCQDGPVFDINEVW